MKKTFYYGIVLIWAFLSSSAISAQVTPQEENLSMGPGYIDDIYYNITQGIVETTPRDTWDIAFYTARFSAGILTNEGIGVTLYCYPNGDTSAWSSIDTAGMSTWPVLHNSPTDWEEGAFNANEKGHPDYGWGIYNQVNHHVYGDSLFLITIPGAGTKKIWIREKKSIDNIYIFTFANIDGSEEVNVELDVMPYVTKNFIYYSLTENKAVDREPDHNLWDLLFTKYIDYVPDNEGNLEPYLVTGATNNVGIGSNHFYPANPTFNEWYTQPLDSLKNAIGYDWKSFDMGTFSWVVTDSNYYFVEAQDGNIWRLKFLTWEGSGTGNFSLEKWLVSMTSVDENKINDFDVEIFPNPATSAFTIRSSADFNEMVQLDIVDQSGRRVYSETIASSELERGVSIQEQFSTGLYIIRVSDGTTATSQKLLVK